MRQPTPEDIPAVKDAVDKCGQYTRKHYVGPGWWDGYARLCKQKPWTFNDKTALPLLIFSGDTIVGMGHLRFRRGRDMPQTYVQKLGNIWMAQVGFCIVDPYQTGGYGKMVAVLREYITKDYGAEWIIGETDADGGMAYIQEKLNWKPYRKWRLGDGTVRLLHGKDLRGPFDINIMTGLTNDTANPITFKNFNQVAGWSMRKAFEAMGLRCNFVNVADPEKWEKMPEAEHTLVIAAATVNKLRDSRKYYDKVRSKTRGKLCMYLDSDYAGYDDYFDRIFTIVKPRKIHGKNNHKYVHADWGADSKMFKPQKTDTPTMFVDAYRKDWKDPRYKWIYDVYDEVMKETDLKVYHPIHHHYSETRVYWTEMQKMLNESDFFCCTQGPAESGLPRIESATAGCLLVVPEPLYMERTMGTLEHRIWRTKDELVDILSKLPDTKLCRRKALKHSWKRTVERIWEEMNK